MNRNKKQIHDHPEKSFGKFDIEVGEIAVFVAHL
jgi:hypothetical protein